MRTITNIYPTRNFVKAFNSLAKDVKELANWYYKLEPYFINDDLPDELDKAIANIPF